MPNCNGLCHNWFHLNAVAYKDSLNGFRVSVETRRNKATAKLPRLSVFDRCVDLCPAQAYLVLGGPRQ